MASCNSTHQNNKASYQKGPLLKKTEKGTLANSLTAKSMDLESKFGGITPCMRECGLMIWPMVKAD